MSDVTIPFTQINTLLCPLDKAFDGGGVESSYSLGWNRALRDCLGKCPTEISQMKAPNFSGIYTWEGRKGQGVNREMWTRAWYDCHRVIMEVVMQEEKKGKGTEQRVSGWVEVCLDEGGKFDEDAMYRVRIQGGSGWFYATSVCETWLTIRICQAGQLGAICAKKKMEWVSFDKGGWGKVRSGPFDVHQIQKRY